MTQEDKELLLKDLCARLPYGVKVNINSDWFYEEREPYDTTLTSEILGHLIHLDNTEYSCKPYLRPMSSMTKKEKATYTKFRMEDHIQFMRFDMERTANLTHYCYSRHLDVNHLIEKGLALEAPEDMYKK